MTAALASTLVSAVFAALVLARYARSRRRFLLMWGTGLALFAIASAAGVLARSGASTELAYRVFYLAGAVLNVAWLALGTVTLLARRRAADVGLALVAAFSVVAAFVVLASPVDLAAALDSGRGFQEAPAARALAALGSGVGTVVLGGGAILSGWGYLRRGQQGRRAIANLTIAAGVLVTAAGGTATFTGASGIVELTNLVGVTIMFIGFLLA